MRVKPSMFAKSVRKILMSKNLQIKIQKTNDLGRFDSDSPHCVGLDHDRAIAIVEARLVVTWGLWKAAD